MGAVRRIGDPHGNVYGTADHQAPEAGEDPDQALGLYTTGRTLGVLLMDFGHTAPTPKPCLCQTRRCSWCPLPRSRRGLDATASLAASLPTGGALPSWLSVDPARRVSTRTAADGVTAVDVEVTPTNPL